MYKTLKDGLIKRLFDYRDMCFNPYMRYIWIGGVRRFEEVPLSLMEDMMRIGFADPTECQNSSPSIGDFIRFCRNHPETEFTFNGYLVARTRDDTRISIEGMDTKQLNTDKELVKDFLQNADELSFNDDGSFHSWYD